MSTDGPRDGLLAALEKLQIDLNSQHVSWAIVGGIAIALRVLPRTTEDVDVMLAIEDDRVAQKIIGFLFSRGWQFVWEREDDRHRIASTRLRGPGRGDVIVDLLIGISGIEAEVIASAEKLVISGELELPVATTASLIALKILAGRDKDQQDIEALIDSASAADIQLARRLLELIERRGYDREKDLIEAFHRHLQQAGRSISSQMGR